MSVGSSSSVQEAAIAFLETYEARRKVYDAANETIRRVVQEDLRDDFSGLHLRDIDDEVLASMCKLVDVALGVPDSDLASYYLHECVGDLGHGGGIECCALGPWELRNTNDLRRYVAHCADCNGQSGLHASTESPPDVSGLTSFLNRRFMEQK